MDDKIRYYLEKLKPHLVKEDISFVARLERKVGDEFESLEVALGNSEATNLQKTLSAIISEENMESFIKHIKESQNG